MTSITVRAVWPELPEPSAWLPTLEETRQLNWHTNFGPLARRFEAKLQSLYAVTGEVAVSTSNATSGLSACLIAHRIRGPVICPAFTFQATACAILGAGCQPVIVDVDALTGVVSPETLDVALTDTGAKAAILLSPYGFKTDFRAHSAVCQRHAARLIIDSAAGLGVARDPALAGAHVDEVYSLHATKPFGIGEGGVIFTASKHEAALRSAMNFGLTTHSATGQDQAPYWGVNGKLTEISAAIGLSVAATMAERVHARQAMAAEWVEAMEGSGLRPFCTRPELAPWQVFPVVLPDEPAVLRLVAGLAAIGIEVRRYYAPSLGSCQGMRVLHRCQGAQQLAARVVALPMRSFMAAADRQLLMRQTRACVDKALQEARG